MASYQPTRSIKIEKPCGESWEAMPGDARVRHCSACDRDVHNVAAMTPAQIEAILAQPGPLPCMRLVRNEDGSLLTATVEERGGVLRRASMALSTVMLLSGSSAAQTMRAPQPSNVATLAGRVTDATGAPIARAQVKLRVGDKQITAATTDAHGDFVVTANPGSYTFDVSSPGFSQSEQKVNMHDGVQRVEQPISLQIGGMDNIGTIVVVSDDSDMATEAGHVSSEIEKVPVAPMKQPARRLRRKKAS